MAGYAYPMPPPPAPAMLVFLCLKHWRQIDRGAKVALILTSAINVLCASLATVWAVQPDILEGAAGAWAWSGFTVSIVQAIFLIVGMIRVMSFGSAKPHKA